VRAYRGWYVRSRRTDTAPRALLVATFDPQGLRTIVDYIRAMVARSRLRIDVLNLFWAPVVPPSLRLDDYQCVIIHPTACYDPERMVALEAGSLPLGAFRGVKVMLKQDEHYRTARTLHYMRTAGIDVVATCLDADEARRVYDLPGLDVLPVLPGYTSPDMLTLRYAPLARREIDVGYRGSPQPWNFGRLAYEKWQIGERFAAEAAPRGVRVDISSRWEDRFFGQDWFDFLGRCKATLGVESGANIFDYTGEVEEKCKAYRQRHPDAQFEEVYAQVLAPQHDNVRYRTVSPRHFEAAACRTLQILYEGEYRGIFQPWRHYVPLRRDFGNFEDVLRALRDEPLATELAERAFKEIACNPAYGYAEFVRRIDDAVFARLGRPPSASGPRLNGSPRVLVGVREIANNVSEIAQALAPLAARVDSIAVVNRFYPSNRYTHALRPKSRIGMRLQLMRHFFSAVARYDLFVFVSGMSFFPGHLDLPLLRAMGKTIVMMNVGDDVRFRPIHSQLDQALLGRQPLPALPELSGTRQFLRTLMAQQAAERLCSRVMSMRNQATFQSRPFYFFRFPMRRLRESPKAPAATPLIVHAPSDPASKGTKIVAEAMQILAAKRLDFRYELIMNRDNAYVMERLQRADILIDQPGTWVARLAVEAMACSCAVIGGNEPQYEGAPPDERSPVQPFEPNPQALARRVEALVADRELRGRLMAQSLEYWERAYSPEAFARYFAEMLEGRGQLVAARPGHKQMLLDAAPNAFQRGLIRALVRAG
jgi:hypothetical protein